MKTTIKLNASGLKTSNCAYKFHNILIEGYKAGRNASRMVYGIGLHKYIDTMYKTKGHIGKARDAALAEFRKPKVGDNKFKHLDDESHFLVTCFNYWDDWVMKNQQADTILMPDDLPATEVTFSIPYYEDDNIIVQLEGTIDRLIKIKGGIFAINDFKSTSSWNASEYLNRYAMSHQLRFYVMALKLMGERYPDSMLGQIGVTNVGACIDGIFLKPRAADNEYKRSEIFQFNAEDLGEVRRSLDIKIQQLSKLIEMMNTTDMPAPKEGLLTGACEDKWGMCSFWSVCRCQSNEVAKVLLARDFTKKPYDPLHHNDDI